MTEHIIHLHWDGPHTISELHELHTSRDYGVYAIYGYHPVYGSNVLLYIGKARQRKFAERILEEGWDKGSMEDPDHTEFYVGRLKGSSTPPENEWSHEIDLAERLLIHVHAPAYNSTLIGKVSEADAEVCNTRVLNWGCHRALRPEVSGLRWTLAATEQAKSYKVYDAAATPTI